MVFAALSTTVLGSQQRVSIQTLTECARHCGQMSTLSFTLVYTMFLFLLVTREISDFVCFQILQAYYLMINMVLGNLRFKTKSQEPRFAQESLGNLGSWFWFGNSKICSGVVGESWLLVLGFSRECILNAFFPECRECILNAFFPECYH